MVGYESGMIMRCAGIRYPWMEYDELVWVWSETWEGPVTKVDIILYMYDKSFIDCLDMIGLCQCVIPWNL